MRGFTRIGLVALGGIGLVWSAVQAQGRDSCGDIPQCGPGAKVVVELSPPEVVFQQAPAPAPCPDKTGFFKRLCHPRERVPLTVPPTAAPVVPNVWAAPQIAVPAVLPMAFIPVAAVPVAVPSIPLAAAPVSYAATPQVIPAALPQMGVPQNGFPASPLAVQPALAATVPQATSFSLVPQPTTCPAAVQEADLRAAAALLSRIKETLAAQEAAQTAKRSQAARAQGMSELSDAQLVAQVNELKKRVEQLKLIVVDHEDRLIRLEKK